MAAVNNDLIRRSEAIEVIRSLKIYLGGNEIFHPEAKKSAICAIDELPSVDAIPAKHGQWLHLGGDEWCCSQCGDVIHTEGSWEKPTRKFCSECGVKMYIESEKDE